jgi:hypothetical protein
MPEIRVTDRYIRMGVRGSEDFQRGSLRTHDIGRKGFSKRIGGKLKRTGKWATQSFLVSHEETPETKERFFRQANYLITREHTGTPLSHAKLRKLL